MRDKILDLLRDEARLTNAEIARRLGIDEATVKTHIDDLEKSQTVLGYRAVVNPEKLTEEPCVGIIEVHMTPQREVGYDEIAAQIYKFPEVKFCYLVSGTYDVLVIIEGSTLKDIALFVARKLSTIEHVTGTATHFILKKYKDAGVTIHNDENMERLPVTP